MFTPDDIQARVRERPFVPLRIVTSEAVMHVTALEDLPTPTPPSGDGDT